MPAPFVDLIRYFSGADWVMVNKCEVIASESIGSSLIPICEFHGRFQRSSVARGEYQSMSAWSSESGRTNTAQQSATPNGTNASLESRVCVFFTLQSR